MNTEPIPPTADPFVLFEEWFADAREYSGLKYSNAMTLATVDEFGLPDARIVLLKSFDRRGFVFYTNTRSQKGRQIAMDPRAALCFYWEPLMRQIRIRGSVERVSKAEADEYFATRPRMSRIGAWASDQSDPMADRSEFERRLRESDLKFPGDDVPRPLHWSGYRVVPEVFEFWFERDFRLHERTQFLRTKRGSWEGRLLFP